jgi:hypothetical protein
MSDDVCLVYNRPALVEQRFTDTAQVRFTDNGTLGYVPLAEVEDA